MPGPVMRNPTPQWLTDPSVTDSAMTKALRWIGQVIGADNPTSQIIGLMGTTVPSGKVVSAVKEYITPRTSFKPIKAGDSLGPYVSGHKVDNLSSIEASLSPGYVVEPELQSVPLTEFYGGGPAPRSYSVTEQARTDALAEAIRGSKRMDPLIVVRDAKGSYVLEGGHRLDAAYQLNATHVPALVVRENGIR